MIQNVSGHTGAANTERWKNTNRYNIKVIHPDGTVEHMRGIKARNEYSTAQDFSFKLQKGRTVIEAWPDGSAGVGGYVEGRRIELDY